MVRWLLFGYGGKLNQFSNASGNSIRLRSDRTFMRRGANEKSDKLRYDFVCRLA